MNNVSVNFRHELNPSIVNRAIVGGSRVAFGHLFRHYEHLVHYCVARAAMKSGYKQGVEDLAQEVWCRFLNNDRRLLRCYDGSRGKFGHFIGLVAYQQALYVAHLRCHRRHEDRLSEAGDVEEDEHSMAFVATLVQNDLLQKLVAKADEELSTVDRRILREHHINGETLRSLAAEMGVDENRLHQRNKRLKVRIALIVEELDSKPPLVSKQVASALAILLVAAAADAGLESISRACSLLGTTPSPIGSIEQ